MDLKLSGKRALVTGSTAGIGEAIARLLAVEGASIAIHGRDEGRGNQLVGELKGGGTRTVFIKADLSVPDDIVARGARAYRSWRCRCPRETMLPYIRSTHGSRAPLTSGRACMRSTSLSRFV